MAVIVSPHARAFQRGNTHDQHLVRDVQAREVNKTPSGVPVTQPLPVSVRVLTGFFVVLGALVVGIITWRIVVWRRRKLMSASQRHRLAGSFLPSEKIRPVVDSTPLEKQETLVILPIEPPPSVKPASGKWKPQIPVPPKSAAGMNGMVVVDVKGPAMPEGAISPPPTYSAMTFSPRSSTSSSTSAPRPPALKIPTVTVTHNDSTIHLPLPPVATPVPSPRRMSSFQSDGDGVSLRAKPSIKSVKGEKLPRKMVVEHTFIPSLADELAIKVGETLTLLEEYEDEWCLVERVGSRADERGVIPRFCLKEKEHAARRGHRRGASSVSAARR